MDRVDLGIGGLGEATQIGAGGAAIVYRARQGNLGREVAIKVLSNVDEDFVRRFQREAKTLGKLSQNPGIVTVYDTGKTTSGQPYLVLELCESSLLDKVKAEGRLDPTKACSILSDVAEAVGDAHDLGIIHRDIKPANMLLSPGGRYLITDFGIASVSGTTADETASIGFTAAYAAPETFQEDEIGPGTDVYAIGASLFHLVAGHPPFVTAGEERNLLAVLHRVATEPVPDLRPRGVPAAVCDLIESAMAKKAADRPTVRQLADQLADASFDQMMTGMIGGASAGGNRNLATIQTTSDLQAAVKGSLDASETSSVESTLSDDTNPSMPLPSAGFGKSAQATGTLGGSGASDGLRLNPGEPNAHHSTAHQLPSNSSPAGLLAHRQQPYPTTTHKGDTDRGLWVLAGIVAILVIAAIGSVAYVVSGIGSETAANGSDPNETSEGGSPAGPADDQDGSSAGPDGELVVPPLEGRTEEKAVAELERLGANYDIEYLSSETVNEGLVIRTTPPAEATTSADTRIVVYVSAGERTKSVPNVVGMTAQVARARLIDAGFDAAVDRQPSATIATGSVISTEPKAGEPAALGATITLTVSSGSSCSELVVPELAGTSTAAASTTITDAGLMATTVDQPSSVVPAGNVISSSPGPGACVAGGDTVTLAISCKSKPIPSTDGMTSSDLNVITDAGFNATIRNVESTVLPSGSIASTSPAAGTPSCVGSDVVVTIATAPCSTKLPAHSNAPWTQYQTELVDLELTTKVTETPSLQIGVGRVISTTPAAGAPACPGDSIAIAVSSGPVCKVLPIFAGQTQQAAEASLNALGFQVTTTSDFDTSVPRDSVIDSTPAAGTKHCQPKPVGLSISKGTPIIVPSVVGMQEAAAASKLLLLGLSPKVTYSDMEVGNPQIGAVTAQSLAPASKQEAGTTISLTVGRADPTPPFDGP